MTPLKFTTPSRHEEVRLHVLARESAREATAAVWRAAHVEGRAPPGDWFIDEKSLRSARIQADVANLSRLLGNLGPLRRALEDEGIGVNAGGRGSYWFRRLPNRAKPAAAAPRSLSGDWAVYLSAEGVHVSDVQRLRFPKSDVRAWAEFDSLISDNGELCICARAEDVPTDLSSGRNVAVIGGPGYNGLAWNPASVEFGGLPRFERPPTRGRAWYELVAEDGTRFVPRDKRDAPEDCVGLVAVRRCEQAVLVMAAGCSGLGTWAAVKHLVANSRQVEDAVSQGQTWIRVIACRRSRHGKPIDIRELAAIPGHAPRGEPAGTEFP